MRPRLFTLSSLVGLLAILGASCAPPAPVDIPTAVASTRSAPPVATPHAAEIRFGLIGQLRGANVWALFDSAGYSYNDYAVRADYWPRLYHLTIPDGKFEPQAASGLPSPVQAESAAFTAMVPLRADLKWTDGSPFTAEDVAFTVNTVISFRLGFDWSAYYDPDWLSHAEALDAHTVKFYFKRPPGVAAWQYGALQGPVVQKKYWSPRINDASALLPSPDKVSQIERIQATVADLQSRVQALIAAGMTASGDQARELQTQLQNQQGNLDGARNDLAKAQAALDTATQAARQSLFSLDMQGEPTLGTWMPAGQANGTWTNAANPSHPFGSPAFDRALYTLYADQASAVAAINNGDLNAVLDPHGLPAGGSLHPGPGVSVAENATSSLHFLLINPARAALADPALRRALFCAINRPVFVNNLIGLPSVSFVPARDAQWLDPEGTVSCGAGYDPSQTFDQSRAVAILKAAGYAWDTEPTADQDGAGLRRPDGQPLAPVALLAPSEAADPQTAVAANLIAQSIQHLGIPLNVQSLDPSDIRFAAFNSHGYDLAILGWRASAYPGYLCDWFGDGNPFGFDEPQIRADCAALSSADLDAARSSMFDIQSILAQNPPWIPLFSGVTYDMTRGIVYPFDHVTDGLSGVYGAPSLALPAQP